MHPGQTGGRRWRPVPVIGLLGIDPAQRDWYRDNVLRCLHHWLVVISLVILIGGHWVLLQSAAWAGMFYNFSARATIAEAVTKTFSGEHPCQLCKIVRAGKKAEKTQEIVKLETKFDFSVVAATSWLFPPEPCRPFIAANIVSSARFEVPPTPPPRHT